MFCPLCGVANPPRAITCAACGSNLDVFGRAAPDADSQHCPRCGGSTPALPTGPAAYCMRCGKPLPGALAVLPATPDPDLCPLCQQKCARVQAVFQGASDDLARELAPPRKPLRARFFRAEGGPARGGAGRNLTAAALLAAATARAYTAAVWTLAALAVVLLLLALNKVGSYRELSSVAQSGVGSLVAARVAASLPYLLGALAALAAALGLLAIKETVDKLRKDPALAYQRARRNWESAYYCPTDRVVFIRTVTTVLWDPVEELQRLVRRDSG